MKILLYHWHVTEAEERAVSLREAGHEVEVAATGDGPGMRAIEAMQPSVFVIDLRRLPSHGRAVAFALRGKSSTRGIPIVFVKGDAEKTERLRADLPDATFTTWGRVRSAVKHAVASAPKEPVVPRSTSGYSGKPLAQKLGIKSNSRLLLVGEPSEFRELLGVLPETVTVRTLAGQPADVIVLFANRQSELERRLPNAIESLADKGALWVAWRKLASGMATDVGDESVRACALDHGLVDVKVCAIDAVWSGLCMRRRAK